MILAENSPADGVPLASLCGVLGELAPLGLAESWDNVGLLVGDRGRTAQRVMTCLTVTPAVVEEAREQRADLVVSHHPLPFKPLGRITADTVAGGLLLRLAESGVAVYSAHTAFDSAAEGINQQWADLLGLSETRPLHEFASDGVGVAQAESAATGAPVAGSGRYGRVSRPMTLEELVRQASAEVGATAARRVGPAAQPVTKVALACGSGASFLSAAHRRGCDALLTGEASFHSCLEAEALGIGLGLLGHYPSERFSMEWLATELAARLPGLHVWASRRESDPIVPVR